MTAFLTGLALGLASSAHCAAMCGPLVMAAGRIGRATARAPRLGQPLLHHAARTATYALLAAPAGLAAGAMAYRGLGRAVAVMAALALLVVAAGSLPIGSGRAAAVLSRLVTRASAPALRLARSRPITGPLAVGVVNGLLPCGLVYGAMATAAATGSVVGAMTLMAGFGIGSSVTLIALAAGAASVPAALGARLRPLAPLVLVVAAAILVLRGVMPSQHAPAGQHLHHMQREANHGGR
jgi:sulfite exporter TauE/SafE